MATLLFARHGETDWNREGRFQGHAPTSLNDRGRAQARALAAALDGLELHAIYSSDLPRARETAEIVASSRGMDVALDAGLREVDVGAWQGLTWPDIAERFPDSDEPAGGEPREVFWARVVVAVTRIARAHDGERVLLVAHGGVVRAVQRHVLGEPLAVLANCGLYSVRSENGSLRPID